LYKFSPGVTKTGAKVVSTQSCLNNNFLSLTIGYFNVISSGCPIFIASSPRNTGSEVAADYNWYRSGQHSGVKVAYGLAGVEMISAALGFPVMFCGYLQNMFFPLSGQIQLHCYSTVLL